MLTEQIAARHAEKHLISFSSIFSSWLT